MLRAALTALVLATATVACGGGASGPAVVAGAPAGDVTEVTGSVSATRDGKTRPLVVGDVVSGDDVIETGADGRVAIRLRHNLVPWALGANKKEQVAASLAWKAPRASQVAAGPTGERSGAAGRHAEREAAESAATAGAAAPVTALAPPAAAAAPGAAPDQPKMEAARADTAAADPQAAEPERERAPRAAKGTAKNDTADVLKALEGEAVGVVGGAGGDDAFGAGGLGLSGTGAGGGGTGEGIGLGDIGTLGHGAGAGSGRGLGAGGGGSLGARAQPAHDKPTVRVFSASGGLPSAVVTRVVRQRNARLIACVQPVSPVRAVIRMTIAKDGKVNEVTVSGVSGTASSCLTKWIRATTFPTADTVSTAGVIVEATAPDL